MLAELYIRTRDGTPYRVATTLKAVVASHDTEIQGWLTPFWGLKTGTVQYVVLGSGRHVGSIWLCCEG